MSNEQRFRSALIDTVLSDMAESGGVIISGPNGSGLSFILSRAGEILRYDGADVCTLTGSAQGNGERLSQVQPESTIVFDELELADAQVLDALNTHLERGGGLLAGIDSGSWRGLQQRAEHTGTQAVRASLDAAHRVIIEPLLDHEIERLLHVFSDEPIDSDTVYAVCELAEGRPRWAADLLAIAQYGSLTSCPRPTISHVPLGALHLPAVQSLRNSIGDIAPEIASMAVALSEFPPRDATGIIELIGDDATDRLFDHGILVRKPGSELSYVPPFIGFALRQQADPTHTARIQRIAAQRLLTQQDLGFPISSAEAAQCARILGTQPVGDAVTLTPGEARTLHQVAADLICFNEQSTARTLLVRAGTVDRAGDPLHRTRALSVLAGPAAGLAELETVRLPEGSSHAIAARFLHAQFAVEHDPQFSRNVDTPAEVSDAERVFRAWNTVTDLPLDSFSLQDIAERSEDRALTDSAVALHSLDRVMNGVLPESGWLLSGDPIPMPERHAAEPLRLVLSTTLLAQGLTALVAGELARRSVELRAAALRLDPREYNMRWLRHLLSAGTALACGDLSRARIEWEALQRRVPRFIPIRLRESLARIGEAITTAGHPEADLIVRPVPRAELVHRFVSYLTGQHDVLIRTRKRGRVSTALPAIRLANAHLTASVEQNPSELMRVAQALQRRELWAPAAFALMEARAIYLSRRASGGVRACDQSIAEFTELQRQRVSWHRSDDLPTSTLVRLTPREHTVARLAADGLTNKQIADQLGCSPRTVESHLAQARSKLGAESRRDLVHLLAETPLSTTVEVSPARAEPPASDG